MLFKCLDNILRGSDSLLCTVDTTEILRYFTFMLCQKGHVIILSFWWVGQSCRKWAIGIVPLWHSEDSNAELTERVISKSGVTHSQSHEGHLSLSCKGCFDCYSWSHLLGKANQGMGFLDQPPSFAKKILDYA